MSPTPNPHRPSSRGLYASLDLMLVFLILVSLLIPLLSDVGYDLSHAQQTALSRQRLSVLLQESQLLYSSGLTPRQSLDLTQLTPGTLIPNPESYYSKDGYLDPVALARAQLQLPGQANSMGLFSLQLSVLPPAISNPNQICVSRLMLLPPVQASLNDPNSPLPSLQLNLLPPIPQTVWVCGW